MRRLLVVFVFALGAAFVAPAAAGAAGGPVPALTNGAGASAPGGHVGYVAVGAGRVTVIERVRRRDGFVLDSTLIRGQLGVPGVAYDGATTGLSADGRTLVL